MTVATENAAAAQMEKSAMTRKTWFTLYHAFALSLALHSAVVLPMVAHQFFAFRKEPQLLVIDFNDDATDEHQVEEKIREETKAQDQQQEKEADKPKEMPKPKEEQPVDEKQEPQQEIETEDADRSQPPPPQAEKEKVEEKPIEKTETAASDTNPSPGTENKKGEEQQQNAQHLKTLDRTQTQAYNILLQKKIRSHLVYPEGARRSGLQGFPKVAFTILTGGQLRPDSLKLVKSSGQPKLDAAALEAIRASAPFDPPPKDFSIVMDVDFFNKH